MGQRSIPGVFRAIIGNAFGLNLLDTDTSSVNLGSAYTRGATIIDEVQPPIPSRSERWKLQAVSIQAQLSYFNDSTGADSAIGYGRLGKLIGAVQLDLAGPSATQDLYPMLPLPQDSSLITTIWDPVTDPMPPVVSGVTGGNFLSVWAALNLPQSQDISPDTKFFVGMWLLPSLIGRKVEAGAGNIDIGLAVFNAKYTLVFDDGH